MILIDTNILVALANPRDALNARAVSDLQRLAGRAMTLAQAVLVEACALIPDGPGRLRLRAIIDSLDLEPCPIESDRTIWAETFKWLRQYAEHEPDWTDGILAVLSGRFQTWKVWTYDGEFSRLWRRPDGSPIPLAVRDRGK